MASIRREITIDVPAAQVWSAMRDVGALHTRLAQGFVTDCRLDGAVRSVSFANGLVVDEVIVTVDDEARRLVWSARSARLQHHNASSQVLPEGGQACRVLWVADLLPDDMAPPITGMIEQGLRAMKSTLEGASASS